MAKCLRPYAFLFILLISAPSRAQYVGGSGSGASSGDYSSSAAMPLTLLQFIAEAEADRVTLRWSTANEVGTDYFIVERTSDGRSYTTVGQVDAAGMSSWGASLDYRLYDPAPLPGSSLYRLKSVDLDGSFTYSELVEIERDAEMLPLAFSIHPNPSTGSTIGIGLTELSDGEPIRVEVLDAAGRRLVTRSLQGSPGEYLQLQLRDRLPAGTYFLRLSQPSSGAHTSRLVVTPFG